jgi:hypothetical protein
MTIESSLAPADAADSAVEAFALHDTPPSRRAVQLDAVVSRSREFHNALDRMARVAPTKVTVLVTGETGTGRGLRDVLGLSARDGRGRTRTMEHRLRTHGHPPRRTFGLGVPCPPPSAAPPG